MLLFVCYIFLLYEDGSIHTQSNGTVASIYFQRAKLAIVYNTRILILWMVCFAHQLYMKHIRSHFNAFVPQGMNLNSGLVLE